MDIQLAGTESEIKIQLREREIEILEAAQSIAHIGSWEWKIGTDELYSSKETMRILGLDPEKNKAQLNHFYEYAVQEDKEKLYKARRNAEKIDGIFDLEFKIISADGKCKFVHARAVTQYRPERNGLIMTGTLQDVTELKLSEIVEKRHLDFEHTILHLAQNFINTPLEKLESSIIESLQLIAEYCDADRAVIIGFDWNKGISEHLYEWHRKPEYLFDNALRVLRLSDYENDCDQKRQDKAFIVKRLDSLPKGSEFRKQAEKFNIVSLCSYPMAYNSTNIGVITFTTVGREKEWSENDLAAIKIFCEMMTSVMLRKKKEEKLKAVNEINNLMLNSTSDAIAMYDYEGNLLSANAAYKFKPRKLDKTDEIKSCGAYGALLENRRQKMLQVFETGDPELFEDERDGIALWNRYYPVFKDGKIQAVTLFSTDITARKKAEEETRRAIELQLEADLLRKREKEYLEILNSFTEATWINDFKLGYPMHSDNWLKRIGGENVPQEEMGPFLRNLIHSDDIARVDKYYKNVFKNKSSKYRTEFRVKLPDGSYIWIRNQAKIYYDEYGNPEKAYGTLTDITNHKESHTLMLLQNKILKTINMIHKKALVCHTSAELSLACLKIIKTITKSKYSFISEKGNKGTFNLSSSDFTGEMNIELNENSTIKDLHNSMIQNVLGCITNKERIIHTNDAARYFEYNSDSHPRLSAFIGIPFFRSRKLAGILSVAKEHGIFTEEDQELMMAIAPTVLEVISRKRAEDAVRENEILLKTIMDSSSNFLFIKDKASRTLVVNKAFSKAFGIKMEDIIGKNSCDLHPKDPEEARKIIENDSQVVRTGQPIVRENILTTLFGKRTFLSSKVPWRDSNGIIKGIIGVAHDITELKSAENSLRESLASLKRSKDHIDLLYETTRKILSSPKPLKDIAELLNKMTKFLDSQVFLVYLTDIDNQVLKLNAYAGITDAQKSAIETIPLGTGISGQAVKHSIKMKVEDIQDKEISGTELIRPMDIRAYASFPLILDDKAFGTISFGSRTKNSFSQEELILMETVAENAAVAIKRKQNEEILIMQAIELKTVDKNKNDFLSSLSHELRNPLATIVAGLSLMDISKDAEKLSRTKETIRRQVKHLCNLVDDLLDISRISINKFELKKEIFDLNSFVLSVSDEHRPLFIQKNILFDVTITEETFFIDADPVRIRQMIGNLLFNALNFTGKGGEVSLRMYRENVFVAISVQDTGKGIEPEFMQYLFEPFSQADKSPHRQSDGLGLGLSIVKAIAESHSGKVKATSQGKDKGSEFTVFIPINCLESK